MNEPHSTLGYYLTRRDSTPSQFSGTPWVLYLSHLSRSNTLGRSRGAKRTHSPNILHAVSKSLLKYAWSPFSYLSFTTKPGLLFSKSSTSSIGVFLPTTFTVSNSRSLYFRVILGIDGSEIHGT